MSSSAAARFPSVRLRVEGATDSPAVAPNHNPLTERSDELLLTNICAGDRESLALLFRRYAHLILHIGERILRDRCEAEDLVQEVFLYLHKKSGVFDRTKGSARSWVVQVAYTQALLRRRELKGHGFYLSGIPDKQVECHQNGNREGANYDHTVEGLFGRNGWKKIVEELTEDQRETLRLHFFEGLTFTEIAETLGQSHRNIRNHHYRGLEKLRKCLSKSKLNWR
jgi:RNA polymerase sigma-70 factor, ECF subfamily